MFTAVADSIIAHIVPKKPAKASEAVKRVKSDEVSVISYYINLNEAGSRLVITQQPAKTWGHWLSASSHCMSQAGQLGVFPNCGILQPSQSSFPPMAPSA